METLHTIAELRDALQPFRGRGTIGLAPTMGALHEGTSALRRSSRGVRRRRRHLFVNPAQFADPADLDGYPRDAARDAEIAAAAGVDLLFAPAVEELYPLGFATWVDPAGLPRVSRASTGPVTFAASPPSA